MTTRPSLYVLNAEALTVIAPNGSGYSRDHTSGELIVNIPASASVNVVARVVMNRATTASKGAQLDAVSCNYRVISGTLNAAPTRVLQRQDYVNAGASAAAAEAITSAVAGGTATSANNYQCRDTLNATSFDNDALATTVTYLYTITFTASAAGAVQLGVRSVNAEATTDWA